MPLNLKRRAKFAAVLLAFLLESGGIAAQGAVSTIASSLPQLFPVAVVVAIVGLIGSLYKSKVDREVGGESNNAKIFESVIKDNASLRAEKDKLAEQLRAKTAECADATTELRIEKSRTSELKSEVDRLKVELDKSKASCEDLTRIRERYLRLCRIIESNGEIGRKFKELNISAEIYTE